MFAAPKCRTCLVAKISQSHAHKAIWIGVPSLDSTSRRTRNVILFLLSNLFVILCVWWILMVTSWGVSLEHPSKIWIHGHETNIFQLKQCNLSYRDLYRHTSCTGLSCCSLRIQLTELANLSDKKSRVHLDLSHFSIDFHVWRYLFSLREVHTFNQM